ncbi:MAG TPA: DUF4936 family protein [Casimicrobiaceae bacterium]|nr:DUF4936 family protein [Casimicrobiaceae bacterium]
MATHYFVWYKVPGDAASARAAVNGLMQDIAMKTGVTARLLMRPESPPRWMEVYESVADHDAFEAAYLQAVSRHGVAEHAPEGRNLERFFDAL